MDELIGSGANVFTGNVRRREKKGYWSNFPSKVTAARLRVQSGVSSTHPKGTVISE